MTYRGNRPDCAYFVLLGVALAAFFIALGGVCSYVAFWPESALSHEHHHRVTPLVDQNEEQGLIGQQRERNKIMQVVGPLCLVIGAFVLVVVTGYGLKYRCDYEPEEPNIAFLRLASEMSLNFDPERNKYRLMRTERQILQEYPMTTTEKESTSNQKY